MSKEYPAGKYYVGDVCYVNAVGHHGDRWNRLVDMMFPRGNDGGIDSDFVIDGIELWKHGTAFGDGNYPSSCELTFPVDSGSIGIVSAAVAESEGFYGGHLVDFDEPFTPSYENGTFDIGHLQIFTDYSDDEDDYSGYEEESCDDDTEYLR